jgi:hypothetical protein
MGSAQMIPAATCAAMKKLSINAWTATVLASCSNVCSTCIANWKRIEFRSAEQLSTFLPKPADDVTGVQGRLLPTNLLDGPWLGGTA